MLTSHGSSRVGVAAACLLREPMPYHVTGFFLNHGASKAGTRLPAPTRPHRPGGEEPEVYFCESHSISTTPRLKDRFGGTSCTFFNDARTSGKRPLWLNCNSGRKFHTRKLPPPSDSGGRPFRTRSCTMQRACSYNHMTSFAGDTHGPRYRDGFGSN